MEIKKSYLMGSYVPNVVNKIFYYPYLFRTISKFQGLLKSFLSISINHFFSDLYRKKNKSFYALPNRIRYPRPS
jgi:hypothetical protein